MTCDQITVGVTLRVIAARGNRPVGTIARMTQTGVLSIEHTLWFTILWLTYLPKLSCRSLRMWEEDLPTFEIVTGPIVIPLPTTRARQRPVFTPAPQQTYLPFTMAVDNV